MSKKKNDIIYGASDIERYHKGLMSPVEMHALEKAALDDPFLSDALEGFDKQAAIPAHIEELKERLKDRLDEKQTRVIPIGRNKEKFAWWKLAAMIILIAGAGLVVYQVGFHKKSSEIALAPQKEVPGAKDDKALPNAPSISKADTALQTIDSNKDLESKLVEQEQTSTAKETQPQGLKTEPPQVIDKEPEDSPSSNAIANAVPGIATEETISRFKDSTRRDIAGVDKEYALQGKVPGYKVRNRVAAAEDSQVNKRVINAEGFGFNKVNVFRGRVTDSQNNALPFSNITNTRDSIGTYADANGFFNLISPDTVLNVRVSSIGFEPSIVSLHNDVSANRVKLEEDRTSLSEVVVSNKKTGNKRALNNNMVLQDAEPADGWSNYDLYLANNLKEPGNFSEKKDIKSNGEVVLSFEVSPLGEPINVTVKKSLCDACDKEAIRVLKEGPKWKRKTRKGKTTVTIRF